MSRVFREHRAHKGCERQKETNPGGSFPKQSDRIPSRSNRRRRRCRGSSTRHRFGREREKERERVQKSTIRKDEKVRERERDKGKADGRRSLVSRSLFYSGIFLRCFILRRGISLCLSLCLTTRARAYEGRPERWCRHKTNLEAAFTNKSMCLFILQNAKWSLLFPLISSNAIEDEAALAFPKVS